MRKFNCALLITLSIKTVFAGSHKELPLDIKTAQKTVVAKAQVKRKTLQGKLSSIQKLVRPTYSQLKKLGGKKLKMLEAEANKIAKDKYLTLDEKAHHLNKLLKANEKLIKESWKKVNFKNSRYKNLLQRTFPNKKISFHEVGSVSLHPYPQIEDPAAPDYTFSFPYSYPFEFKDNVGVGGLVSNETSVDLSSGENSSRVFTMWFPYTHAMAGVSERLTLPHSVQSIKVTVNIFVTQSSVYSVGMLGLAYSTSSLFLDIVGNNSTLCEKNYEINSSMSPVLWAHQANSTQIQTISCTVNVRNVRDLVITTGGEAFAMNILNGGAFAHNRNFIESIDVEILN